MHHDSRFWWERVDRHYDAEGRFCFGGTDVSELVAQLGTPSYVYSAARITQNVTRLQQAIADAGLDVRLLYAMKSNRFPPLLRHMATLGVGLDVCSPGEVDHALGLGFAASDLSFTAGCLSREDHRRLAVHPDLWINADSRTALRRWAEVSPGRSLGLRINPQIGLGYADNDRLVYSKEKPSKFGIHPQDIELAMEEASQLGLRVRALHCHAGCGYLDPQLAQFDRILGFMAELTDRLPGIREINLGGGLGIPLTAADQPLDLHRWAALVHKHFAQRSVQLLIEPGDYLVKDAGALLVEITQVERKAGVCFVGVNAGFNVHPEPAFYNLPMEAVPAVLRPGQAQPVSIVGNINEALDVWAENVMLGPVQEDDTLCFLNAGGYGSSMSSQHCLRGGFREFMIEETPAESILPGVSMDELNRNAWERLYSSSAEAVWGAEALPFLSDFAGDFRTSLRAPSRLLDAGAGEGRNLPFLAGLDADELHALDAAPAALGKIPDDRFPNLHKHLGSLADTGFEAGYFDGIILLDTFETLPNIVEVLNEMHRVLRPGGVLLCNVPGMDDGVCGLNMRALSDHAYLYRDKYYFHFYQPSEARALMERCGFKVLIERHVTWEEPPHPGFRDEFHEHTSHVFLISKPEAEQGSDA